MPYQFRDSFSASSRAASLAAYSLPSVVAVVVTHGRSQYLPQALVALAGQTIQPSSVIICDAGARADPAIREMAVSCGVPIEILTVVHAARAKNFGQAVTAALVGRDPGALTWLLHDDCYPEPDCLANQMACIEVAPSVAVVGPKQVQARDPSRLGEVGVTTTPFGRRVPNGQDGELDQGQYDALEDVLAVGSAGMLVRSEVWQSLSGFAAALGPFRDGLEFCRRARLAGHRVVVEPSAVIEHEQATFKGLRGNDRSWQGERHEAAHRREEIVIDSRRGRRDDEARRGRRQPAWLGQRLSGLADLASLEYRGGGQAGPAEPSTDRSFGARRRALIFAELADASLWALIPIVLAAMISGVGRFFWRIAAKDFRLAVDEIWAPVAVITRFDTVARARYIAHRTRRLPRRRLASLRVSAGEARQARRDRRITQSELRRRALAPTEIEMAEHRELASHRRSMVAAVALMAVALTAIALYRLIGPGFITGGALGAQDASITDLLRSASGGWLTQGLGEAGPGDPFNAVLALMTLLCFGDGATAVKLALLLAPLLAALGAWFAAGAATRSVWLRAWAGLFYLATPALWLAVSDGRLGAVVSYAALPWAMLGVARAIGVNRLDVRPAVADAEGTVRASATVEHNGSLAAASFAGLAFAATAAGSPALLVPGLVAAAAAWFVAGPGRRARLIWLVLPALALFLPLAWDALFGGHWRALLADPGPLMDYQPAPLWLQLLGWPAQPVMPGLVPVGLVPVVAAALTGALAVAALVALFRTGPVAQAVRFGWFLALTGAVTLLGLDRLAVAVDGLQPVPAWTGGACALVVSGLLMAAVTGLTGLTGLTGVAGEPGMSGVSGEPPVRRQRLRLAGAVAAVVLLAIGPLAGAGLDVWHRLTLSDVRRAASDPMPPIVAAEADGPRATYALVVSNTGSGPDLALRWDLVRGTGHQISESQGVAGSRRLAGLPARIVAPGQADQAIGHALAVIAGRNPGDASAKLATYGIGFILASGKDQALAAALDATGGLSRVREDDQGSVVWQVAPLDRDMGGLTVDAAARLHIATTDGKVTALDSGPGTNLRLNLAAGSDGRRLVLAEQSSGRWRATLDGERLKPVPPSESGDWCQVFELPAWSGKLHVWYTPSWGFALVQVAVLGLAVLLALPIRRAPAAREES